MEITISNLQSRFNFFSYSAFQKYKNDKCNNKSFFSCKKDFYNYLENMYKLEFDSRKKIFNTLDEEDLLILSLILEDEEISDMSKFSTILLNKFLEKENIVNIFNINSVPIGKKINEEIKLKFFLKISNKLNHLKLKENWSHFDEFLLFQIITNLKRFTQLIDYYTEFFKLENNSLIIFPYDKENKIKLIFHFDKNKIQIYEEEQINSKLIKTKLKEPKWISKINKNRYSYMDHKFNFLTVNLDKKIIFYNGISILGSNILFELNTPKTKITFKKISKFF